MHTLRFLEVADAELVADYQRRNRHFHRQWSPIPPPDYFTPQFHRRMLQQTVERREREEEFRFGIFSDQPDPLLIGRINLVAIERGAFQNGRLGYSIDAKHRNSGIMTAMLKNVMGFGFGYLRLHRIEANIMPRNEASRRVLQKCGFRHIGYSPKMLLINGQWEDHELYMALAEDLRSDQDDEIAAGLQPFLPLVDR